MKQFTHRMQVATRGKGLYSITEEIEKWVEGHNVRTGLLTVFSSEYGASCVGTPCSGRGRSLLLRGAHTLYLHWRPRLFSRLRC